MPGARAMPPAATRATATTEAANKCLLIFSPPSRQRQPRPRIDARPQPYGSHTKQTYAAPRWQTTTSAPHVGQRIPCLYVPPWIGHGESSFAQVAQMRQDGSARGISVTTRGSAAALSALQYRVVDVLQRAERARRSPPGGGRSAGRRGSDRRGAAGRRRPAASPPRSRRSAGSSLRLRAGRRRRRQDTSRFPADASGGASTLHDRVSDLLQRAERARRAPGLDEVRRLDVVGRGRRGHALGGANVEARSRRHDVRRRQRSCRRRSLDTSVIYFAIRVSSVTS